ncbi:MAG: hypothetical protein HY823_06810 [Acidobacteria bacterium]|nr:hypothetical protein [Acidobacteriota bacterium]
MILFGATLLLAFLSGLPGLFMKRGGGRSAALLMGSSAASGLLAALQVLLGRATGAVALPNQRVLDWGFLHLDPLGAIFLIPVCILFGSASVYGLAYWDDHRENSRTVRAAFGVLAGFLILLTGAQHAFTFLLGWEGMALAAFVLVMAEDRDPATRRAGYVYLAATHTGTLFLFSAFALLPKAAGGLAFGPWTPGFASSPLGSALFLLFLAGFAFKAGALPLHFWLPPAHSAAPSHVSAVMSGVLIKMGILGLARLVAWVPDPPIWWGGSVTALGLASGVLGVAFALGQHDLKRLLAYHSIENIGIILLGLGLGLIGKHAGSLPIQLLGFGGALLHVVNHALFKGLLFLAAGSAAKAAGTRDLEALGGLARRMPRTSLAFLAGAWAICGLPPLNGFVSEWMIYLAAFQGLGRPHALWSVAALGALALIGALALACFAKAFGAAFLGEARSPAAVEARESPPSMVGPMGVLAGACAFIGFFPVLLGRPLDRAATQLAGAQGPPLAAMASLTMLSLMALPLLAGAWMLVRWSRGRSFREGVPTWDCGYTAPAARMQYTASSFAEGLMRGMRWVLWPVTAGGRVAGFVPRPRPFSSHLPDLVLDRAAEPGLGGAARGLGALRFLQAGHLPIYLLYVLLTLLGLFVWMVA